jgi:hypothetical protein
VGKTQGLEQHLEIGARLGEAKRRNVASFSPFESNRKSRSALGAGKAEQSRAVPRARKILFPGLACQKTPQSKDLRLCALSCFEDLQSNNPACLQTLSFV